MAAIISAHNIRRDSHNDKRTTGMAFPPPYLCLDVGLGAYFDADDLLTLIIATLRAGTMALVTQMIALWAVVQLWRLESAVAGAALAHTTFRGSPFWYCHNYSLFEI